MSLKMYNKQTNKQTNKKTNNKQTNKQIFLKRHLGGAKCCAGNKSTVKQTIAQEA